MGRYTDRSRIWELAQTFGLFLLLIVVSWLTYGVLAPLIIFFAASRVAYKSWATKALIVLAIHCVVMSVIVYLNGSLENNLYVIPFLCAGSAYVFVVFMSFHIREYLERLDLKKYMKLEMEVSYSYRVIKDNLLKLEEKEVDDKAVFLAMIEGYRMKIMDKNMAANLQEMEHLTHLIVEKDTERSALFYLKHTSALDSILKQYIELQDLPIIDPGVEQLKAKLYQVIGLARDAFENELVAMFDVEIMSSASEADFYKSYVQSKGLI